MLDKIVKTNYIRRLKIPSKEDLALRRYLENADIILRNGNWVSSGGLNVNYWITTEKLISNPDILKLIAKYVNTIIITKKIEAIAACSISGIPWAVAISLYCNMPLIILRKKRESHGEKSFIIGDSKSVIGKQTLLVDDSILTGKTIRFFYGRLKKIGCKVENIFVFDLWKKQEFVDNITIWAKQENISIWYAVSFNF